MNQPAHGLAVLDQFRRLLANAETIEDLTDLRSRADAVRIGMIHLMLNRLHSKDNEAEFNCKPVA